MKMFMGSWSAKRLLLRRFTATALAAALVAAVLAVPAGAAERTALDAWLDGLHSLRTGFTQTVKDAQGKTKQQSSGELLVLRPGRFRWETHEDAAAGADSGELLVADGRSLWWYDRELQQVQVKPVDAALSATPMMLLSGGADVRKAFDIAAAGPGDGMPKDGPAKAGLEWVRVKPKGGAADFRQALLGFDGGQLQQMVLEDKAGQVMTLVFDHAQRNAPVSEAEVSFTPPAGADVIGTVPK